MSLIIDIGCGGNPEFEDKMFRKDAIGIDIRPSSRANFIRGDVEERLPFDDGSVSKAYFYDVIEHLDSPGKALKEILRVLKPGGELEMGTPNALYFPKVVRFALKGTYTPSKDHVATYGLPELRMALERAGFEMVSLEAVSYSSRTTARWEDLILALCPFPTLKARQLRARARKP